MITTAPLLQTALLFLLSLPTVYGWGGDNSCSDTSIFGNALSRDWLSDSSAMSIKFEGCMYGYASDNEEAGCMENESEDGTYYWYMMANCLRPQAVYSVYASSGNSAGCNSGNFKESVSRSICGLNRDEFEIMIHTRKYLTRISVYHYYWSVRVHILPATI